MGFFDGFFSSINTAQTNAMNSALTKAAWKRDDTAHQREVADLKAAGLNPILSAGGSGAGTTSPIPMQKQTAFPDPTADIASIINMASVQKGMQVQDQNIATSKANEQMLLNLAEKAKAETQGVDLDNKFKELNNPLRVELNMLKKEFAEKTNPVNIAQKYANLSETTAHEKMLDSETQLNMANISLKQKEAMYQTALNDLAKANLTIAQKKAAAMDVALNLAKIKNAIENYNFERSKTLGQRTNGGSDMFFRLLETTQATVQKYLDAIFGVDSIFKPNSEGGY